MRAFHRISRHVLAAVAFCPLGAAPAYAQIAASVPADFTVAAVGDMIQTRPIVPIIEGQSPELLKILQDADVTFGNYETTALDFSAFDGHPEAPNGGSTIFSEKTVPADLKAMGFDIVSRANNHVTDWGVKGMQISNRLLDDAGVVKQAIADLHALHAPIGDVIVGTADDVETHSLEVGRHRFFRKDRATPVWCFGMPIEGREIERGRFVVSEGHVRILQDLQQLG